MRTDDFIQSIKAALTGTVISVVFALLLALIAYFSPIGERALTITAQSLKAVSLLLGCFLCFFGEGGWKKGLLAGVLFAMLTYLSFSAIAGNFGWSWKWIIDLALGLGVGFLSGIAAANLKKV